MASVIEGQILSTREQLAEFARARMFIAARAELIEAGFSPSQINSWTDVGRLTPVLHGIYSYGRDVESRDAALKAGLAAAGTGSALTGTTACEKWGLVRLDLVWLECPLPEVNVKVHGFEVDMYWRAQRFALELDGGAFHSDPAQKKIDLEKQRFLEGQGETVERLTYRQYDADPIGNLVRIAQRLGYR